MSDARFMQRFCDRYCYLGGGSTTTTTKNETDPQIKALMLQNYSTASGVADTPFQAYTGQRVANFNPTQVAGQAGLLSAANDPTGTRNLNAAASGVGGVLNYSPADVAQWESPYTNQVVNATLGDLQHARDVQGVNDNQAATAAHAFGGSRQGVQNANTTNDYLRTVATTSANLRDQGYNNAVNASSNAAGIKLNAGNSLANISNQQLQDALTRSGVISGVGDKQQIQQQDVNDAAYEEFMRQIAYPQQQQNIRNAAIGLLPNDGTQTGTSTKKYGLGDFLMAGISGASKAAAGGAFG